MKSIFAFVTLFTAATAFAGQITCSPTSLAPGDKLTIKIEQALPDVAVITPKKLSGVNFFMLTEAGTSGLIQSNQLASQRGMVIDVDTAKLDGKNRLFFTLGVYEFVVSKNLETDDGTPTYKCKVRFADSAKSQAAAR